MGIGLGVVLLLAGAILYWAVSFDLTWLNEDMLGVILMIVGALTIILSLVLAAQSNRTKHIEERRFE